MAFRRASCRALAALSIALAAPAGFAQSTVTLNATSGTGTISTNYTTTGGLTLDLGFFAEYLVVGGGGGGGGSGNSTDAWGGGGGGAGGLLTGTTTVSATSYTVTVGGGGAGGQLSATAANQQGSNGANSVFGTFATGTGGGGGGRFKVAGNDGGSGGGGGGRGTGDDLRTPGGNGIAGQGSNGGDSRDDDSTGRSAGGGGGGAGAVGGTGGTNVTTAGNGGAGLASSITGTSVIYAGGGGGGAWDTFDGETAGSGGSGGGGAGSTNSSATAGTDNFGGGGGGVGTNGAGGRGGSGIVIVRYEGASLGAIGGTVTSGSGSAAGYTLHTFTTTGTSTLNSALNLSSVDLNARLATTLTGTLTGSGNLTFAGPGTLTLAADNTFTGDTRIASGTLAVGSANALASSTLDMNASDSGSVTFSQASIIGGLTGSRNLANGGNTLTIGGNNASTTYSGVLSGTGGLTKQGTGTLTLTGTNTYSGLTTVSGGTLAIGSGGTSGSIAGDIANSGAVVFNRSDAVTYAGSISGTGGLTKQGADTLTLTGSSSFTGDTRVAAGILTVSNANALAGSTLDMNASDSGFITFSQASSIGGLTGSRNLANGGNTLSIGGNNASTTYSGVLSGTGGLTKQGSGTLTLTGNNTYSGLTTVSSGTLAIGSGGTSGSIAGNIANSGAVVFNRSNALTYTGSISGTGGLTKQGAGALTLTGSNTYTGPTTVSSGTLFIGSGGASGSIVGDIANSGAVVFNRSDAVTYAGSISGTGGLTKQGAGTLTLTGSSSFTGDTRVTQGTLVVANANALSASTLDWAFANGITFMQASILGGLKGANSFSNGGYTLTIGGNGQSTAYSGRLLGAGGLTKTGVGTLTLAEGNSHTGDTRIVSGTLAIGNTYSLRNSTLDLNASDSGSISFSQNSILGGLKGSRNLSNGGNYLGIGANNQSTTYSGVLSGAGGLVKFGAGTLTLTGNNTYTGLTEFANGTLAIGDGGTAGSLASSLVILKKGTSLTFNRSDASTYAGNITGIGSLTKLGAGTLTLTGSNTFKGVTTVSAGTLVLGSGNALATTAAVTVASGATLDATVPIRIGYIESQGTVTGSNNLTATLTVTRSGTIGGITDGTDSQGTFAAGIVKLGTGTSTVNSANAYTGLTWVQEGTLAAGLANAFAAGSDLTVDSPATFDRAGFSQTVADADIDGVVANSSSGGLLTIAGTLSGTGVLNGNVLINGVHAPGNSPGIQTFNGDLTYGSGAVINWELIDNSVSTSPSVFDQVFLGGSAALTFSGSNVLSLSFDSAGSLVDWTDVFWDVNQTWTLFDLDSGSTTGFNFLAIGGSLLDSTGSSLNTGTRGSFSLGQTGQDVVLLYTAVSPVPEIDPAGCASVVALVIGALGHLERRRNCLAGKSLGTI